MTYELTFNFSNNRIRCYNTYTHVLYYKSIQMCTLYYVRVIRLKLSFRLNVVKYTRENFTFLYVNEIRINLCFDTNIWKLYRFFFNQGNQVSSHQLYIPCIPSSACTVLFWNKENRISRHEVALKSTMTRSWAVTNRPRRPSSPLSKLTESVVLFGLVFFLREKNPSCGNV